MIYDPLETEASRNILLELLDEIKLNESFGIVGGWAVHSLINEDFLRATGREFLRSRDIDIFIDCGGDFPCELADIVKKIGFTPGEYKFRYTLVLDRDSMRKLSEREARRKQIFELIYVFLDVLGNEESNVIGVWPNEIVGKIIDEKAMEVLAIEGRQVFVPRVDLLFLLKIDSFLQRGSKEKRMKDACDIYGLLFYSRAKILEFLKKAHWKVERARHGIKAMLNEEVLEFIADELFGDRFKSGLVRRNLSQSLEQLVPSTAGA